MPFEITEGNRVNYRQLGDTGLRVSEISFGTWAIGGSWGQKDDKESIRGLERAMEAGVNFFDTADVYGGGHAEELLAQATRGREDDIHIATKFCRAGDIHDPATYSEQSVRAYCENSLKRCAASGSICIRFTVRRWPCCRTVRCSKCCASCSRKEKSAISASASKRWRKACSV